MMNTKKIICLAVVFAAALLVFSGIAGAATYNVGINDDGTVSQYDTISALTSKVALHSGDIIIVRGNTSKPVIQVGEKSTSILEKVQIKVVPLYDDSSRGTTLEINKSFSLGKSSSIPLTKDDMYDALDLGVNSYLTIANNIIFNISGGACINIPERSTVAVITDSTHSGIIATYNDGQSFVKVNDKSNFEFLAESPTEGNYYPLVGIIANMSPIEIDGNFTVGKFVNLLVANTLTIKGTLRLAGELSTEHYIYLPKGQYLKADTIESDLKTMVNVFVYDEPGLILANSINVPGDETALIIRMMSDITLSQSFNQDADSVYVNPFVTFKTGDNVYTIKGNKFFTVLGTLDMSSTINTFEFDNNSEIVIKCDVDEKAVPPNVVVSSMEGYNSAKDFTYEKSPRTSIEDPKLIMKGDFNLISDFELPKTWAGVIFEKDSKLYVKDNIFNPLGPKKSFENRGTIVFDDTTSEITFDTWTLFVEGNYLFSKENKLISGWEIIPEETTLFIENTDGSQSYGVDYDQEITMTVPEGKTAVINSDDFLNYGTRWIFHGQIEFLNNVNNDIDFESTGILEFKKDATVTVPEGLNLYINGVQDELLETAGNLVIRNDGTLNLSGIMNLGSLGTAPNANQAELYNYGTIDFGGKGLVKLANKQDENSNARTASGIFCNLGKINNLSSSAKTATIVGGLLSEFTQQEFTQFADSYQRIADMLPAYNQSEEQIQGFNLNYDIPMLYQTESNTVYGNPMIPAGLYIGTDVANPTGKELYYVTITEPEPAEGIIILNKTVNFGTVNEKSTQIPTEQTVSLYNGYNTALTLKYTKTDGVFNYFDTDIQSVPSGETAYISIQPNNTTNTGDYTDIIQIYKGTDYLDTITVSYSVLKKPEELEEKVVRPIIPAIETFEGKEDGKERNIGITVGDSVKLEVDEEKGTASIVDNNGNIAFVISGEVEQIGEKSVWISNDAIIEAVYTGEIKADLKTNGAKVEYKPLINTKTLNGPLPTLSGDFKRDVKETITTNGYDALCMVSSLNEDTTAIDANINSLSIVFVLPKYIVGNDKAKLHTFHVDGTSMENVESTIISDEDNWIITITSEKGFSSYVIASDKTDSTPSHGGSTSFSAKTVGADGKVTFDRAMIVTEGTFPGATSVKLTNSTGEGWYNFDLSAPGFTGNGSLNFKVPLDVLAANNMTSSDVGLYHQENNDWILKPTTYLKSDSQYAYYTGTFDSCSPFKIDFETGAAKGSSGATVTEKPDTQKTTDTTTKTDTQKTTTETPKEPAAKSPVGILAVLTGLGIAGIVAIRRR